MPHPSLADAGTASDPRLAAVLTDDGEIDRVTVQRLLFTAPSELTIEQLKAMQVIVFEQQVPAPPAWIRAFVAVTGGVIETETTRHENGRAVRTWTRRRYRGRRDVRQYRARFALVAPRPCARPRAARPRARRTSSSSTTSGCDPSSGSEADQPGEPPRLAPSRAVLVFGCLTAEARGQEVA